MPLGPQADFPATVLLLKCEWVTPSLTSFPGSPTPPPPQSMVEHFSQEMMQQQRFCCKKIQRWSRGSALPFPKGSDPTPSSFHPTKARLQGDLKDSTQTSAFKYFKPRHSVGKVATRKRMHWHRSHIYWRARTLGSASKQVVFITRCLQREKVTW